MARLAVVGNATRDVNRAGGRAVRRPGGTLLYASLALKALGHDVHPIGWAPLRAFGWLKRAALDTSELRVTIPGTQFLNVYEGDERKQWARRGPVDALADAGTLSRYDGVLLGPVLGEVRADVHLPDGLPALLDVQGCIRRLGRLNAFGWREVGLVADAPLPRATHVRGSRDELRRMTGASEPTDAVKMLHDRVGATTIVTLGAEGALAYDGAMHRARPASVGAIDPTGAGDVFDAGLLHGIVTGRDLDASLRLACAAAATFLGRAWTKRTIERFGSADEVEAGARAIAEG